MADTSSREPLTRAGTRSGSFRVHARRPVRMRTLLTHVGAGWQRPAAVENIGLGARLCLTDGIDQELAIGVTVTRSFHGHTTGTPLVLRARGRVGGPGDPRAARESPSSTKEPTGSSRCTKLIATLGYE